MAINTSVKKTVTNGVATVPSVAPMDISALIAAAVADAMAKVMAPSFVAAPKAQAVDPKMVAEIARLKAENAKLAAAPKAKRRPLTCRVSVKGAVSVYGLGQWPATYYKEQWEQIFAEQEAIKAFIKANDSLLSVKGDN